MCDSIACITISRSACPPLGQTTVKRSGSTFISCKQRLRGTARRNNEQTSAPNRCVLFQHEGLGSCQACLLLQVARRVLEIVGLHPCDKALNMSTNRGCGFNHPLSGLFLAATACQHAGLVPRRLSTLSYFVVKHRLGTPHAHLANLTLRLRLAG